MAGAETGAYTSLKSALMVYKEDLNNLNSKRVGEFVSHHYDKQRPRLIELDSYYKGVNTKIHNENSRRLDEYGADARLGHPFAQEIADFHTSYSVGNPVNIGVDDGKGVEPDREQLDKINDFNDVDTLFYELFSDMSKFGRAFATVYRDKEAGLEKITRLSPLDTFLIYSNDIDPKPVMAVRYTPTNNINNDGNETPLIKYIVETWTASEYQRSTPVSISDKAISSGFQTAEKQVIPILPVVEIWNNSQRMGDYDGVISLIDAYDASQSDTANYMQDSNDAMLVIQGDIEDLMEEANLAADPSDKDYLKKLAQEKRRLLEDIRKSRTLFLKSGISATGQQTSVSASYISKQYDSAGVEAYKDRLYNNIHSFSRTPDVSNENFASNASGVAMQYKQLGVIQLAKTKRRMFEKGLSKIYEIIQTFEQGVSGPWKIDFNSITFMFTDNLPTDDVNTIQTLQSSGATFPREYLDRFAPGVSQEELKGMRERQDGESRAMTADINRLYMRDKAIDDEDEAEEVEDNG